MLSAAHSLPNAIFTWALWQIRMIKRIVSQIICVQIWKYASAYHSSHEMGVQGSHHARCLQVFGCWMQQLTLHRMYMSFELNGCSCDYVTYNNRSRSSLSASLVNESVSVYSSRLRRQHGGRSSSSTSLQCSNSSLWCSSNISDGNKVSQLLQLQRSNEITTIYRAAMQIMNTHWNMMRNQRIPTRNDVSFVGATLADGDNGKLGRIRCMLEIHLRMRTHLAWESNKKALRSRKGCHRIAIVCVLSAQVTFFALSIRNLALKSCSNGRNIRIKRLFNGEMNWSCRCECMQNMALLDGTCIDVCICKTVANRTVYWSWTVHFTLEMILK